jgi:hypothetical protein
MMCQPGAGRCMGWMRGTRAASGRKRLVQPDETSREWWPHPRVWPRSGRIEDLGCKYTYIRDRSAQPHHKRTDQYIVPDQSEQIKEAKVGCR